MVHEEKSDVCKEISKDGERTDVWGSPEGEDIMHNALFYSGIKC